MVSIQKLLTFLLLLILAVLFAGVYGVVHNQISYSVSPEYFTRFKFDQFGLLDSPLPERIRASIVGFLASWWMGLPIGFLVGSIGFIHRDARRMFRVTLASFAVIVAYTLLFGLLGLAYGCSRTGEIRVEEYSGWYIPPDVTSLRRFLCAGYMHNASYLGGVLAIPVAWVFHGLAKLKFGRRPGLENPASRGESASRDGDSVNG